MEDDNSIMRFQRCIKTKVIILNWGGRAPMLAKLGLMLITNELE